MMVAHTPAIFCESIVASLASSSVPIAAGHVTDLADLNRDVLACEDKFWILPMPPAIIAIIFGILGLMAIWGIQRDISSGSATGRGWTCTIDDNPIGFCLIVSVKVFVIGLAIAEILHAFGLADPIVHIKRMLPAFLA
jgi:hypothetical protein